MNENTEQPIPEIPEFPEINDDEVADTTDADADNETVTETDDERRRLLDEAEQRGYLRGRNEMINRMMDSPQLFADLSRLAADNPQAKNRDDPADSFLTRIRPRVWD